MSILSRLFGRGAAPEAEARAEIYKTCRILPQPEPADGGYRVAARIEKDLGGNVRVYHLKRADVLRSLEEAEAFSIRKAKQVIDEQGDALFR